MGFTWSDSEIQGISGLFRHHFFQGVVDTTCMWLVTSRFFGMKAVKQSFRAPVHISFFKENQSWKGQHTQSVEMQKKWYPTIDGRNWNKYVYLYNISGFHVPQLFFWEFAGRIVCEIFEKMGGS